MPLWAGVLTLFTFHPLRPEARRDTAPLTAFGHILVDDHPDLDGGLAWPTRSVHRS